MLELSQKTRCGGACLWSHLLRRWR
jgi:hypothetical protein